MTTEVDSSSELVKEPRDADMKRRVDAIFQALPAPDAGVVGDRVGRTKRQVEDDLVKIRANPKRFGFTVPHIKRGANPDGSDRLYAALVEKGEDKWTVDPASHTAINLGAISTAREIAKKARNEATALELAAVGMEPIVARLFLAAADQHRTAGNSAGAAADLAEMLKEREEVVSA